MLSALLLAAQIALAGGPMPNENEEPVPATEYDPCMIGVLMDWEQDKALVFGMTGTNEVDLQHGQPLELAINMSEGIYFMWADVPFNSLFDGVLFIEVADGQNVFGTKHTDDPYKLYVTRGQKLGSDPVTVQGVTGYLYVIDARPHPDCVQ